MLLVFQQIDEGMEAAPGVIEDTVEDHAHPSSMDGLDQRIEIGLRPEARIDPVVVDRVVAVVGAGVEDRVEVKRGRPQILQIVKPLEDPPQVAALKAPQSWWSAPRIHIGRIVRRVAVGESIGEDLIEDGVLHPFGYGHASPSAELRPGSVPCREAISRQLSAISHQLSAVSPSAIPPQDAPYGVRSATKREARLPGD